MAGPTTSFERFTEAAGIALASGDHTSAERALRAAIQAIEGQADSQLELAAVLIKLGNLKLDTGQPAEAEGFFGRALEISERLLGFDHIGLVAALKGLGTTRLMAGKVDHAEPLLARALNISERHLGDDHPDLVILLNDLTRLYLKQGAHAIAEPLLLRLLDLKRTKGEDHPEVATVLASLAAVRQALGRHEAAEQLWRRVLTIRERTLAPNHFALATALEHLGQTCAARGKLGEALQHFQRALTIREATLGRDHASLRNSRERIADLELQASEDSLDAALAVATPGVREPMFEFDRTPTPTPPRTSDRMPVAASPIAPLPVVQQEVATRPASSAETAVVATTIKPEAYLEVLQGLQAEMEVAGDRATAGSRSLVVSVRGFLQNRRNAVIVGASAITIPVAAAALFSFVQPRAPRWVTNTAAAETPPARPAAQTAVVPALAKAAADTNDVIARNTAGATKPLTESKATDTKGASKAEPAPITVPTRPNLVVRIDSVRSASPVVQQGNDALLQRLQLNNDTRSATGGIAAGQPVRARLIGKLPTPRYPAQQLHGRAGGEVRVRFDVDTLGRPIMSTFTVVGSPLPQLANAVKEVIPKVRFEPARTPWPESRPIVETVELAFQFAAPANR